MTSTTRTSPETASARAEAVTQLRRARTAVATIFFLNGVGVASWVVRIPAVQDRLTLSAGALGLALLGMSTGALVSMPVAGRFVVRLGSRPVTTAGALAFAATLVLPGLATNSSLLFVALLATGLANGVVDVAMNAQAAAVEKAYQRRIMTSFHALFSLGGLVGSSLGGVIADAGVSPAWHLTGAGLFIALAAALASIWMPAAAQDRGEVGHDLPLSIRRLPSPLLALGFLAFCILFAEGAMADWSAVYLHEVSNASEGQAAIGYGAFSIMMAAGRLVGDRLVARFGVLRIVRIGAVAATCGTLLAIADPRPTFVAIGFGAIGAGLASSFPQVLSAASRVPGVPAGAGIALASTVGYTGFLSGPPLIGFAAQATDLRGGMAIVGIAGVLIVMLAGSLREDDRSLQ